MAGSDDILEQLREASQSIGTSESRRNALIVAIMSKPPGERGVTTYELAKAIGKSRQQLHQIYRDETGKNAESDHNE